jgi:hypothetical protein
VVLVRLRREESPEIGLRVGHLLRVDSYLDMAILSMWTASPRADMVLGMVEASVRGEGPDGSDADLLEKLRALVGEARRYYAGEDMPAAMARLRVAHDLVSLRIIRVSGG